MVGSKFVVFQNLLKHGKITGKLFVVGLQTLKNISNSPYLHTLLHGSHHRIDPKKPKPLLGIIRDAGQIAHGLASKLLSRNVLLSHAQNSLSTLTNTRSAIACSSVATWFANPPSFACVMMTLIQCAYLDCFPLPTVL